MVIFSFTRLSLARALATAIRRLSLALAVWMSPQTALAAMCPAINARLITGTDCTLGETEANLVSFTIGLKLPPTLAWVLRFQRRLQVMHARSLKFFDLQHDSKQPIVLHLLEPRLHGPSPSFSFRTLGETSAKIT